MDNSTELLIKLCAKTDAIFTPIRQWVNDAGGRAYQVQTTYRAHGVAWASGEWAAAGRKQSERSIKTLTASDSIEIAKPRGGEKTLFVRLTDAGDEKARALCGLPSLADAIELMRTMAGFDNHPDQCVDGEWVSDLSLIGQRPGDAVDKKTGMPFLKRCLLFFLLCGAGGPNRLPIQLAGFGGA